MLGWPDLVNVRFLLPETDQPLAEWLKSPAAQTTALPFDQGRVDAMARWSEVLFRVAGDDPTCASLAYWLRRASVVALRKDFDELERRPLKRYPRGLVFIVAPANVPTMAAYSCALAFLCGNACIVRVSPRAVAQLKPVLDSLAEALSTQSSVASAMAFVSYDRDEKTTNLISAHADVRVFWGGDSAVTDLRKHPSKVTARDLAFVDRFSYAAIKAADVKQASDDQINSLAGALFNDAYWFDQLACASPSVLVWVGSEDDASWASSRLMSAFRLVLDRKRYTTATSVAMEKMTFAFASAATGRSNRLQTFGNEVFLSQLSGMSLTRNPRCGGGYFEELRVTGLDQLAPLVTGRDQTMTYFGFTLDELEAFSRAAGPRGLSRIVPVGKALQFGRFWDGHDLLQELTRIQTIDAEPASEGRR